jgi:Tol biopolymer transport system component
MFKVRMLRVVGTVLLLALYGSPGRAADPEDWLPPPVRPVARVSLQIGQQDYYPRPRYGNGGVFAAFSPDGRRVAAMDQQGQFGLWDASTGKSLDTLGINRPVMAVAFSPDGKTLLTTDSQQGGDTPSVRLWDVATGKELRQLDEGVNLMNFLAVAWSPDGKTLALSGMDQRRGVDVSVHLWDASSGDEVRLLSDLPAGGNRPNPNQGQRMVESLCFAPDGKSLALVLDGRVHLWELSSGKHRAELGSVSSAIKIPDEKMMAWQMRRWRQMQEMGMGGFPCLAFSPDGRYLAVGCPDDAIRLFDVVSSKELPPLTGHRGGVRAVCFTPDGKILKSLGTDGKLLTWRTSAALRAWRPAGTQMSAEQLQSLWETLGGADDPWINHAVLANLAAFPTQSVPFLRERLKPAPMADSKRITELITALSSEDYNTRKKAIVELRKLGDRALPALRKAAEDGHSEILNVMLSRLDTERSDNNLQRALLAVEALERIGTAPARELLAELAKGSAESPLTQRVVAARDRLDKRVLAGEVKLDTLWTDLASDDARKAYRALQALAARPKDAVPLLGDRLRALPLLKAADDDPRRIARLLAELDNDDFAVRDKAAADLKRLGARAEKAMREELKRATNAEVTKRLEELLKEIEKPVRSPEEIQAERALETLERIGTPEAREVVAVLDKETSNRQLLEQIKGVLRRLELRALNAPR